MPPIKGKMMGRMGRSMVPSVSEFERVKNLGMPKKKARMHLSPSSKMSDAKEADNLLKLRYPPSIRQCLPSVKKYKGVKNFADFEDDGDSTASEGTSGWDERTPSVILGGKRSFRGTNKPKYFIKAFHEDKFNSMIWDVAFSPSDDIVISCGDGLFLYSVELKQKLKLDTVILAGGVAFLSDGRIVAICRNQDTVNIFSPEGKFISSFPAGQAPMSVMVDTNDRICVIDPGAKNVVIFDEKGKKEKTVATSGTGYKLRWPLYGCCQSDSSFLIADCHAQTVLLFDKKGDFVRDVKLTTCGSNQVLKPHGICVHKSDVFIIDTATDSVEVFDQSDTFIQTLIPQEEGINIRPKVLRVCDKYLVVGGHTGSVKVFKFMDDEELDIKPHPKTVKAIMKRSKSTGRPKQAAAQRWPKIKVEVKEEIVVSDDDGVEVVPPVKKWKVETNSVLLEHDKEEDEDMESVLLEDEKEEEDDVESVSSNSSVNNDGPPKLINSKDEPYVVDSDESEMESDEEGEDAEDSVPSDLLVVEHVDENVMEFSDISESAPQDTKEGENKSDDVIVLDD